MKINKTKKILEGLSSEKQELIKFPSKENIERLSLAGCPDDEIAGFFKMTSDEYAGLTGSIIQNDPDFLKRLSNIKQARHALSRLQVLERIEKGDLDTIKFDLQSTNKDFNQKIIIDQNVNVHELTEEEKESLAQFLPQTKKIIDVSNADTDSK